MSEVILVDEYGEEIGVLDTLTAHTGEGKLHRAFSVHIFRNNREETLIQRRSAKKMLWPLVWANACCSHPRVGETFQKAGERRLKEEMGFACPLTEGPSFVYRAEDPNGKGFEYEHDTILIGDVGEVHVNLDPNEVAEYKWEGTKKLLQYIKIAPDEYAPWFHIGLNKLFEEV